MKTGQKIVMQILLLLLGENRVSKCNFLENMKNDKTCKVDINTEIEDVSGIMELVDKLK